MPFRVCFIVSDCTISQKKNTLETYTVKYNRLTVVEFCTFFFFFFLVFTFNVYYTKNRLLGPFIIYNIILIQWNTLQIYTSIKGIFYRVYASAMLFLFCLVALFLPNFHFTDSSFAASAESANAFAFFLRIFCHFLAVFFVVPLVLYIFAETL